MLKNEIIHRNPLRLMGYTSDDVLSGGEFGALMARAGVGKTAFLVQIALDKLLRERNVLHISLTEPVDKVCVWYEEVFRNIARQADLKQVDQFWESILPKRFIMTFKVDGFSVPKLQERLTDLTEQGVFFPQLIVIDGLPFDETGRKMLQELKELAKAHSVGVWFSVRTHRHESPGDDGMPRPMLNVADLFEVAIELQPGDNAIRVKAIKGEPPGTEPAKPLVVLDPATLMVVNSTGATAI